MRITTRIAAGGHRSMTRIPFPHCWLEDCLNIYGKIDRVKAQLAFACPETAEYNPFMPSNSDDETVYFAALTFFEQLHDAYQSLVHSNDATVGEANTCKQDDKNAAKLERGKFVYARMDLKRTIAGCRVRLSVGNPKNIVGESELEARAYLVTCAQIWLRMARQVKWLEIEESDIVAEAREKSAAADLRYENNQRFVCPHHLGGFCVADAEGNAPVSSCPHFVRGYCKERK